MDNALIPTPKSQSIKCFLCGETTNAFAENARQWQAKQSTLQCDKTGTTIMIAVPFHCAACLEGMDVNKERFDIYMKLLSDTATLLSEFAKTFPIIHVVH